MTGYQMEPFIAHIYSVNGEDVTDDDYRRIARELHAQAGTWRQFVDLLSSRYSNAWWSRFVRSDITITRQAKNELRAAYGLALLPPTIGELAERLGPDTEVRRIQPPTMRVFSPDELQGLAMLEHFAAQTPPHNAHGTPIPAPRRRAPTKAIRLSPDLWNALQVAKGSDHQTWNELLWNLLDMSRGIAMNPSTEPIFYATFEPGNIVTYLQDTQFHIGIPSDVRFAVYLVPKYHDRLKLVAPGYGQLPDAYGNGAILIFLPR